MKSVSFSPFRGVLCRFATSESASLDGSHPSLMTSGEVLGLDVFHSWKRKYNVLINELSRFFILCGARRIEFRVSRCSRLCRSIAADEWDLPHVFRTERRALHDEGIADELGVTDRISAHKVSGCRDINVAEYNIICS